MTTTGIEEVKCHKILLAKSDGTFLQIDASNLNEILVGTFTDVDISNSLSLQGIDIFAILNFMVSKSDFDTFWDTRMGSFTFSTALTSGIATTPTVEDILTQSNQNNTDIMTLDTIVNVHMFNDFQSLLGLVNTNIADIASLTSTISTHTTDITALTISLTQNTNSLTTLTTTVGGHTNDIQLLTNSLSANTNAISANTSTIATLTNTVSGKQASLIIPIDTASVKSFINGTNVRTLQIDQSAASALSLTENSNALSLNCDASLSILSSGNLKTPLQLNPYDGTTTTCAELKHDGLYSVGFSTTNKIGFDTATQYNVIEGWTQLKDSNGNNALRVTTWNIVLQKTMQCWGVDILNMKDLSGTGSLSWSGTKNFEIPHPTDSSKRIKHACAEGVRPYNMYRFAGVSCSTGTTWLDLPSYFSLINDEPSVHCSPVNCFVQWYANVEANKVKIVTSKACIIDVLVMANRNDAPAQNYQDVIDAPIEVNPPQQ